MPLKAPPPIPYAGYDWSGLYIGGAAFMPDGRTLPLTQSINNSSWLGGVEAGWNYQINRLVIGTEWDFTWTDMKGSNTAGYGYGPFIPHSHNQTLTADTDWIGTGTLRVGYAAGQSGEWLFYSKAGAALVNTSYGQNDYCCYTSNVFTDFSGNGSDTRVGWTVGTGIEWAFLHNWSAKLEYDYIGLGNSAVTINGTAYPGHSFGFAKSFTIDNNMGISEFKFGLNYRFTGLLGLLP